MNNLLHADIFFLVTTIAVVVVAAGLVVALAFLIPTLRNARRISEVAKEETELIAEDVEELRGELKRKAFSLAALVQLFRRRKKDAEK